MAEKASKTWLGIEKGILGIHVYSYGNKGDIPVINQNLT